MSKVPKTNLQYLCNKKITKGKYEDEVDFLPADKRQMFPQIDAIILGVLLGMPKLPKITILLFLCNIFRKK